MADKEKKDENKDHQEAGKKKKTRVIVETIKTTEEISDEHKHDHGLKLPKLNFTTSVIILIVAAFVYVGYQKTQSERHAEVQTPPTAGQHEQPGSLDLLRPLRPAPSPAIREGSRAPEAPAPVVDESKAASAPSPVIGGRPRSAAAPSPVVDGSSGAFTTAACAGIKHTVVLQPGVWFDVDKYNACRIMSAPPPGVTIEAMDPTGTVFNLLPNGEVVRDAVRVRSVNTTVQFSYSRCPKGSAGMRNWDCTPLQTQYAAR